MVTRAVSSWSLHRTLGRFMSGDAPFGGRTTGTDADPGALALLDLPAALRRRGYDTLQICHFHFPSRTSAYLQRLKTVLAESSIELDAILIDDGDLTDCDHADEAEAWIGGWLDIATTLGARRARVSAGRSTPTDETLRESARRLKRLATAHPDIRIVTENWMGMMPDSGAVLALRRETGDAIGLMIDLGNWSGPAKYDELAAIAPFAETCHAKAHFGGAEIDAKDFRRCLHILKDVAYTGPLALIYAGEDDDEWAGLDVEFGIVREVLG